MVLAIYGVTVNLLAFMLCGLDKARARQGRWRIPERTLLGVWLVERQSVRRVEPPAAPAPDTSA